MLVDVTKLDSHQGSPIQRWWQQCWSTNLMVKNVALMMILTIWSLPIPLLQRKSSSRQLLVIALNIYMMMINTYWSKLNYDIINHHAPKWAIDIYGGSKTWILAACNCQELLPGRRWFLGCMSTPGYWKGIFSDCDDKNFDDEDALSGWAHQYHYDVMMMIWWQRRWFW